MQERIYYTITLTTLEAFRVGGATNPISRADSQVARIGNRIVIPGPSLKGALRNQIEKFLIKKFYKDGNWEKGKEYFKPCIPGDPTDDELGLIGQGKYRDKGVCYYASKDKEKSSTSICPVCYLLGANGLLGFVRVPFLNLMQNIDRAPQLYSGRQDRAINTIVHKTNRSYETIPSGTKFRGDLEILLKDHLLDWNFGAFRTFWRKEIKERKIELKPKDDLDMWLKDSIPPAKDEIIKDYIIGCLQNIEFLGGYKSKGCGRVKIEVVEKNQEKKEK